MSLDPSLKSGDELAAKRSVLSRAEKIAWLAQNGKFDLQADDPLNLPKVASRHAVAHLGELKKQAQQGE